MDNKGEIVIYQTQDGTTQLDVRLDGETVWITQDQMAQLFQRDRTAIGRHISNIFSEGELDRNVVCANFAHTTLHGAIEGKTQVLYGSELILKNQYDELMNDLDEIYKILFSNVKTAKEKLKS